MFNLYLASIVIAGDYWRGIFNLHNGLLLVIILLACWFKAYLINKHVYQFLERKQIQIDPQTKKEAQYLTFSIHISLISFICILLLLALPQLAR
jgi:hypothetical protein